MCFPDPEGNHCPSADFVWKHAPRPSKEASVDRVYGLDFEIQST